MKRDTFTLLHTSDLHLGACLYNRRRHEEHVLFLDWLLERIEEHGVDLLLICGDIFDSATPPYRDQHLYFSFLSRVIALGHCGVVVIAGNHDSPSFLSAPIPLLNFFNIHVVSRPGEREVIPIKDRDGHLRAVIGAVPYLREAELFPSVHDLSISERETLIKDAIVRHYVEIVSRAHAMVEQEGSAVPLILMGHLLTLGGRAQGSDRLRDLYVGGIGAVDVRSFIQHVSYMALGHLHSFQEIFPSVVYSGSPIPLGFKEILSPKHVCLAHFKGAYLESLYPIEVPVFQRLERVEGDLNEICERLSTLSRLSLPVWVEVNYTGREPVVDLRERVEAVVEGSAVDVLVVKNSSILQRVLTRDERILDLSELSPLEIFNKRMEREGLSPSQRSELQALFKEVLFLVQQGPTSLVEGRDEFEDP